MGQEQQQLLWCHGALATTWGTSHSGGVSALQRHRAATAGSPEEA